MDSQFTLSILLQFELEKHKIMEEIISCCTVVFGSEKASTKKKKSSKLSGTYGDTRHNRFFLNFWIEWYLKSRARDARYWRCCCFVAFYCVCVAIIHNSRARTPSTETKFVFNKTPLRLMKTPNRSGWIREQDCPIRPETGVCLLLWQLATGCLCNALAYKKAFVRTVYSYPNTPKIYS